ncbi:MAG: ABC transporter substrate-binding protein [Thermomicrobiales bacterium]|nr:ABC transporter substrate-binding protein [Thermomicrobiales bacterium]
MDDNRELLRMVEKLGGKSISRRELTKRGAAIGLGASAMAAGLTTISGKQRANAAALRNALRQNAGEGTRGGTLRVAIIGEPPTLDQHQTTAEITAIISYCMFEGLFTYDSGYLAVPELLESYTVSDDKLTWNMTLRSGVPFHDGSILTSADAVASVERWGQISGVGKRLLEATESITAVDDLNIEWKLTKPYGTLAVALAHNTQGCIIFQKSFLDQHSLDPIQDGYIGTGPYKLVDRQIDAYLRFERFEDYAISPNPTDGYAGAKHAWADVIEFIPVPDEAARVAGLQAGDYHIAMDVGNDQYPILSDFPGIVAEIRRPTNWDVFFLNWQSPLFSNLALREAVQAAFDMEPMLLNGRGSQEFLRLDPGLMMQESPWYTDAGIERYNMKDPDLAKAKMEEAGYDGTPIRWMTTQEYSYMYGEAIVGAQQLEEVGFKVDLQVMDWATVVQRRAIPEEWDIFGTGHGFVPDPSQVSYVGQMNIYPGWWNSEESLALSAQLLSETEFEDRKPIWDQIQANAYTEIPALKLGDSSTCSFYSEQIGGWVEQIERGVPYWNLWLNS